ncbi:MAG: FAD-dependent oxidoreductase [Bacteroidaceae bacterium]|nr:FAD-dependent oxidoreductase [Bacteroidaceae bacterium]
MKRRDFLKTAIIGTGAAALGTAEANARKQKAFQDDGQYVTEPEKQIPILAHTDVLVVGGGPAGTAAAIAASRGGAETYLVERYNHLGGLWTGGLVLPLLSTHGLSPKGETKQVIWGIGAEIVERLRDMKMVINERNPLVDPEATKYLLERMIEEAGVKMVYHAWATGAVMDGKRVKGIFIESKSGRQAIIAKVVIDCTGDGDVYAWAGEEFQEIMHRIALPHRYGGIDKINPNAPGYKKQNVGWKTPTPNTYVKWTGSAAPEPKSSGIDVMNLTHVQLETRRRVWEDFEHIRNTPGYEQVFLVDTASQLGVRMSRVMEGEYRLTFEDSMTYRSFDDVIGMSGSWTAVPYHGTNIKANDRPYWQIPYRSLLPKHIEGLLAAGRCFSYDEPLVEDARVIGTCIVTGQGAGTAAALSISSRTMPRDIDRQQLRRLLKQQNVLLEA